MIEHVFSTPLSYLLTMTGEVGCSNLLSRDWNLSGVYFLTSLLSASVEETLVWDFFGGFGGGNALVISSCISASLISALTSGSTLKKAKSCASSRDKPFLRG